MRIRPISETDASAEILVHYEQIKAALKLPHVPLFFQFIANFPEYLDYIGNQIVENLSDARFSAVIQTRNEMVAEIFREDFEKGKEVGEFLNRYRNTPEFYNFKKDVDDLFLTNAKLVFIFISLREAVKGWAVAAKKLPDFVAGRGSRIPDQDKLIEEELVYGLDSVAGRGSRVNTETSQQYGIARQTEGLAKREEGQLTIALLPEYLRLCRNEFSQLLKTQQFLFLRVELERVVLRSIDVLPHKIESPINVVLELTTKYPTFPDLLYLLSEHFPTYAMHRWLFSAYLIP